MSEDESMLQAYKDGKDLYASVASVIYNNRYEDNLEFYPDGSYNNDGKKRRSAVKGILLGIMYGRGVASIAENLGITFPEAQEIIDSFYKSFPKVKGWMDQTIKNGKELGYVEDLWGRRRRLPDLQLPKYEIRSAKSITDFNPFIGIKDRVVTDPNISKYENLLKKVWKRSDVDEVVYKAKQDGITIRNNGGFIASAERQSVNARIQGGAATMTKIALGKLYKDEQLKKWGFNLLLTVHDEIIGECPVEYAEQVADRLTYIMSTCINDKTDMIFKCDADINTHWNLGGYESSIRQEYYNLIKAGLSEEGAKNHIISEHTESLPETILEILER